MIRSTPQQTFRERRVQQMLDEAIGERQALALRGELQAPSQESAQYWAAVAAGQRQEAAAIVGQVHAQYGVAGVARMLNLQEIAPPQEAFTS